ncbi:MAG TPA: DUF2127 domain-containing protein [Anaeromyxobacteraceae bacterium]|nr:DUF2127 domain-containing protein [Anaeromyxobacteraceae bacterium]
MNRPIGITALAVSAFVGAALAGLSAVSLALPGSPLEPMWRLNPRGHQGLAAMHGWAVAVLGVVSCACAVTGVGLWRRRRWGYLLAVLGLSIHIVGDILNFVLGIEPRAIIGVPIVAALLVYLGRSRVRNAFARG